MNTRSEAVFKLYRDLLTAWNDQNAEAMSALFQEDGNLIGFDGSELNGREEISDTLGFIFSEHPTARFVSVIRSIRFLHIDTVLLKAVVGMIPRGHTELNPGLNAVQSLVAVKNSVNGEDQWRVALFQNTPAALHGRVEAQIALTKELVQVPLASIVFMPIA